MRKVKPTRDLPVNQRDLATYLGISPTMLNLATGQGSRTLAEGLTEKLATLVFDHNNNKKSKRTGKPLAAIQPGIVKEAGLLADKMSKDANYFNLKADMLQRKLDDMVVKYAEDLQWLDIVQDKIAGFDTGKGSKADLRWFKNQELTVTERLERRGIVAQVKLEMQLELAKANAKINNSLLRKLKKGIQ